MARLASTKSTDDYDPREAIKALSDNINQPDKFAETFCAAAKKQKIIDDCLKEIIKTLLDKDPETRENVKSIVKECNREDYNFALKKYAAAAGAIFLLFLGAVFHAFCTKYI